MWMDGGGVWEGKGRGYNGRGWRGHRMEKMQRKVTMNVDDKTVTFPQ